MPTNRREFLNLLGATAALGMLGATAALGMLGATVTHAATPRIRAIAFDAFPIFDPRPIFALAEQLFPGKGTELSNAWRTRQFEYQWLRALAKQYADFWQATSDGLIFAANSLKLDLTPEKHKQLMDAYLALKTWPDVLPALKTLKESGIRLAILSNFTPAMLAAATRSAGIEDAFDHVISTDTAKTFKPDPRAYQLAVDTLKLKREEILFVPFAGWDAAGAKWFGYRTFWVNRLNAPAEELGVAVDAMGKNLSDLAAFARS